MAFCAGILQGVTGFGAGIVIMMVLPSLFPLNQAAGVSGCICLALCLMMAWNYRRHTRLGKVVFPAALYLLTSGVSIYFSTMVNQEMMKKIFGVFLVVLSGYYLFFNKGQDKKLGKALSWAFIIVSGVCDGLFGIGGPLMVIYYLGQSDSKEEYLGNIQTLFSINLVYGTGLRISNHILGAEHLPCVCVGILCILGGLTAARRMVDRLDGGKIRKVTYGVIGISGVLNMF